MNRDEELRYRVGDWSKVTQQVKGRTGIWIQLFSSILCPEELQENNLIGKGAYRLLVVFCFFYNGIWLMLGISQLLTIHHGRCYLSKIKLLPDRKAGVQNWYHFLYAIQLLLKSHCDLQKCVIVIILLYGLSIVPYIIPLTCLASGYPLSTMVSFGKHCCCVF